MRPRSILLALAALASLAVLSSQALAAGEVELQLVTEPDFPATDVQRWYETLSKLKVGVLNIRSARAGDKIEVINKGTKASPIYVVYGAIKNNGELHVPGGRFKMNDRASIGRWLEEMRTYGPQGTPEGKPLYGLNAGQFGDVKSDLSRAVDFSTKGVSRLDALEKIHSKLKLKLQMDQGTRRSFAETDKVEEDLKGMSSGTALAYLLRPVGLAMRPERLPSGDLQYVVAASGAIAEPWPVGWPLEKRRQEIAPQMFEMIDVDIEPIPLSTALQVIGERIEMPVILDKNNLVKHEVNIDELKVSFPAKKSTYSVVLTRLLGQGRLTSDVRVDEADKPFLWVTTLKK
jgi:hypothetical protein